MTKKQSLSVPLNFLLGCSEVSLQEYELAHLSLAANLRAELRETLDRVIDELALAALARWFRENDQESLKRALESDEEPAAWARRILRGRTRPAAELLGLPEPAAPAKGRNKEAHLRAVLRYQERHIATGKCERCSQPLALKSARYCQQHLEAERERGRKRKNVKKPRIGAEPALRSTLEKCHPRWKEGEE